MKRDICRGMSDGDGGTWQEMKTEVEFYGLCSGGFWGKITVRGQCE